jgi:hypothetical protein
MNRLLYLFLALLACSSSLALACGDVAPSNSDAPLQGGSDPKSGTDRSVASSDEGPSLIIVSPRDGEILQPGDLTVVVDVHAFKLVNWPGRPNGPGEGRLIYYLDHEDIPQDPSASAGSGLGTYDSDETTHTFKDVRPGHHVVALQLVDNDGTPIDDPKLALVQITVN